MKSINFTFLLIILLASSCSEKIKVNTNQAKEQKSTISNFDLKAPICEKNEEDISFFDLSCLENDKQYVQAAFKSLAKKINGSLNSISTLENTAQLDKIQYLEEIEELKTEMFKDLENKTLTEIKKNDYMLSLSTIGENIAIATRSIKIELINASNVGKQLEQLIPYLKDDAELIKSTLGYNSIEELGELSKFLISINNDTVENVAEVELAYTQYKIAYEELDKLIEIIAK